MPLHRLVAPFAAALLLGIPQLASAATLTVDIPGCSQVTLSGSGTSYTLSCAQAAMTCVAQATRQPQRRTRRRDVACSPAPRGHRVRIADLPHAFGRRRGSQQSPRSSAAGAASTRPMRPPRGSQAPRRSPLRGRAPARRHHRPDARSREPPRAERSAPAAVRSRCRGRAAAAERSLPTAGGRTRRRAGRRRRRRPITCLRTPAARWSPTRTV